MEGVDGGYRDARGEGGGVDRMRLPGVIHKYILGVGVGIWVEGYEHLGGTFLSCLLVLGWGEAVAASVLPSTRDRGPVRDPGGPGPGPVTVPSDRTAPERLRA
eukprot:761291-Hanusia_phi.AAC.5